MQKRLSRSYSEEQKEQVVKECIEYLPIGSLGGRVMLKKF